MSITCLFMFKSVLLNLKTLKIINEIKHRDEFHTKSEGWNKLGMIRISTNDCSTTQCPMHVPSCS